MPLFDLRCTSCQQREDNVVLAVGEDIPRCQCGAEQEKVWDKAPAMYPFKAGYYEHLGPTPVYIGSKAQLRSECEQRGLTSEYSRD